MSYTLVGSRKSPFTRASRLFLLNSQIDHKFHAINYIENKDDAKYLEKLSPVNKIPVLIDGNQKIFDSRVIFNYLNQKHKLPILSTDQENILTTLLSCLDSSANLLLLKMGGLDFDDSNWYLQRQRARIPLALASIESWVEKLKFQNPVDWNYLTMTLFSYLDWAQFRQLIDVNEFPNFNYFFQDFKAAKGLSETDFRG
jgi:glutathione S-transferase